ncbi:hypothetical protein ACFSQT_15475 [Mesorhizobium calcicola]|uniref:Transposase DDE domain-containing protein n=1 Tax=Mesorhizobium calcicola TaxID=1300310 RepID=A0ABW4WDZ9_9HYPH
MSGGGRFLARGLRAVKAEAALSILAFNIVRKACGGCEWNELCTMVVAGGYRDTQVRRPALPGKR